MRTTAFRDITHPETLPQYLFKHAAVNPDGPALRERIYGIWQVLTWSEYADQVQYFGLGLKHLGLLPEHTLAIVGDNRPEWVIAELAAQVVGAKSIGIYQDAVVNEVEYILTHADVSFIVVEDQEQVDKILEMWPSLSGVKNVIYFDPKGLRNYSEEFLLYFPDVLEMGRSYDQAHPDEFEALVRNGKASDLAILFYHLRDDCQPQACHAHPRQPDQHGKQSTRRRSTLSWR